ncbi:hypothetical protein FOZ63_016047 [Perkinsus olseni]|uniref:Uncharacterized protein n=1 Tax=Perkinsus olseni TaxID=32597 RepID=A0A7J6TCG5_PEROL|nr:hypothetical protein FOZ63_016047 [Perkinsus olseni]
MICDHGFFGAEVGKLARQPVSGDRCAVAKLDDVTLRTFGGSHDSGASLTIVKKKFLPEGCVISPVSVTTVTALPSVCLSFLGTTTVTVHFYDSPTMLSRPEQRPGGLPGDASGTIGFGDLVSVFKRMPVAFASST